MSEEAARSPEIPASPESNDSPSARRISNPRPKKQAKSAKRKETTEVKSGEPESKASKFPEFPEATAFDGDKAPQGDWPEPEAPSSGNPAVSENPKRKRRRKKGKGGGNNPQNVIPTGDVETAPAESAEAAQSHRQQPHAPRVKHDPELLAKHAWKIYLAEVSEEGVALVGDNDAKELSRRCFRLAEIFLDEQARRR